MPENIVGTSGRYEENQTIARDIEVSGNLIREGDFSDAVMLLRGVLEKSPENETAWRLLGGALASQGNTNEAIEAFRQAARFDPYDAKNHYNLGVALQTGGRLLEASESLERALRIDPEHHQARQRVEQIRQQLQATSPPPPPPVPPSYATVQSPFQTVTPQERPMGQMPMGGMHSVGTPPVLRPQAQQGHYTAAYAPTPILGNDAHLQNTSGMNMAVPPAANFWNWGGFGFSLMGLGFIWAFNMRLTTIAIIQLIMLFLGPLGGLINLGLSIYLGTSGSEQAWRNRRFQSIDDFRRCQTTWGWWALGVAVVTLPISVIMTLIYIGMIVGAAG
jgi:tetratricopeptide (TPR) repeat protein